MLGILTSKDIPKLTEDDHLFLNILKKEGIPFQPVIWSETDPEKLKVEALIIRSPWDYHGHLPEFIEFLDACVSSGIKVLNSLDIVKWNASKLYLQGLEIRKIPVIESLFFYPSNDFSMVRNQAEQLGWTDIVVKPTVSATAHLTFKTHINNPDLESQYNQVLERSEGIIQPFISSIATDGEVSLLYFKGTETLYSHAVLKKPKSQDFRVQVDFGGSTEVFKASEQLIDLGYQTLRTVSDPWLYARVDIVDWRTSPKLSELEMIEPNLFFAQSERSPALFVQALKHHLKIQSL